MFLRAKWVVRPLADYGVPQSWWPWLGTAKAAGAAGLLAGLLVPAIGVLAGICLVLYFTGATFPGRPVMMSRVPQLRPARDSS